MKKVVMKQKNNKNASSSSSSDTNLWPLTHPLLLLSLVSLGLLLFRVILTGKYRYWFLSWNLLLAWVPLIVAIILTKALKTRRWRSWQATALSVVWLFFLPNSFYLITDYIHLHESREISLLFDVVLMGMYSFLGFFLGFLALSLVHDELEKRLKAGQALAMVLVIVLLSSFAIYLGRYLRWNSWDVVVNPLGITIDIVDRILRPLNHLPTFATTLLFFVSISSFYFCMRKFTRTLARIGK